MLRLLLIEDNEDDSLLIREMLESAKGGDFKIDWADRLSKGLARLGEAEFDAVLLDLSLPDSWGLETLVKVREQAARLPVIVLSGLNDEKTAVEALQKGAQDYLVKGTFNERLLVQALRYMGIAEMMEDGLFGSVTEEQKKWLNRSRTNAAGLVDLISDYLDVSKLEAGHVQLSRTAIDVQDLVCEAVENFGPLAKSKNIALTYQADAIPPIFADGRRLDQVLTNLLSNALKFTGDGGSIQLRVLPDQGIGVKVQVQDSGVGIPANEIANLFQKYRQVSSATVSEQKGTGLGLVICKMIVQAHGGNISVESTEGIGTIFSFTLPCAKGPERDAAERKE